MDKSDIEKIYKKRFEKQGGFDSIAVASTVSDPEYDIFLPYIEGLLISDVPLDILDAGCGNGKYAKYFQARGNNVVAVDLFHSKPLLDSIPYICSSIESLPFSDSSFDFVFCNSVIYYADDPRVVLEEFYRILKPGGKLFFSAHTKYSLFTFYRIFKRDILKSGNVEHLKGVEFNSSVYYLDKAVQAGFDEVQCDGVKLSFIIYPLYNFILRVVKYLFNVKLPRIKPYVSKNKMISALKSEVCYHSIFLLKKK